MKIQEKKNCSPIKTAENSSHFIKSYSGHQSSNLLKENVKVIKLIHQKIYPLNHSQRSALLFPKLKQKSINEAKSSLKESKKYMQISMEDDHNTSLLKPKGEVEDQMKLKAKTKNKKTTQKYRLCQPKTKTQQKSEENQKSSLFNLTQIIQLDKTLASENNETIYGQNWENSNFFHTEAQRILNESAKHSNFLKKVKQDIQKRKETYYSNVSFTQVFDNNAGVQKQNYTIEYVLNSIQNKALKNDSTAPYDKQSPNKLGQFAKLFENKTRNHMLWEELEMVEPSLQKEKSFAEELKNSNHIRSMNRNQTIIEQQGEINFDNLYAAKYRIKHNHKRMIQLAKTKAI